MREPAYGISGSKWDRDLRAIAGLLKTNDILDYGCGKGTLKRAMGNEYKVKEFDPAIVGKESEPSPADLVVCTDVLEHIEPDKIDAVIDHLHALTRKAIFLTIHFGPAFKTFANGENAHLIQQPWEWWKEKLAVRFHVEQLSVGVGDDGHREFAVLARPLEAVKKVRSSLARHIDAPDPLESPLRIFIGYDPRQVVSYSILQDSIIRKASIPISITPIVLDTLPMRRVGLTPFTFSRFMTPWLSGFKGWSLFLDSDILVLDDIAKLFALADESCSVMVTKHGKKFEWASVMLFNNAACRILTPEYIESHDDLHVIGWTEEEKIGALPAEWNHLVGYDAPRRDAKLVHFTQGVPYYPETIDSEYANAWKEGFEHLVSSQSWETLMGNSIHAAVGPDGKKIPKYKAERLRTSYSEPKLSRFPAVVAG